jgi:peroxiredoxin Q/BCP
MVIALFCEPFLAASPSRAEEPSLKVGDRVPAFQCRDDQGRLWKSRDHIGQRIVVLYFYPSDFSFCCTRQAVRYRDRLRELCDQGVEVVGISGDAVEAHRQFQATHKLNFSLLSDADGEIARAFGVPLRSGGKAMIADENGQAIVDLEGRSVKISRQVTAARWTFVVNQEGHIIYRETEVSPVKDSQVVLDFVRKLRTK